MVGLVKRLGALVLLLGILAGFPVLLITMVGNPWPAGGVDELALMSNSAVLGLVSLLGWFVWAQLLLCTLWEIPPALRNEAAGAPRLPIAGGGQQRLMRALVHTVLAVGVSSTLLGPATATSEAAPTHPIAHASAHVSAHSQATESQPAIDATSGTDTVAHGKQHEAGLPTIVTGKGATLWGLADTHLGDGYRWPEIADLNRGRMMTDGHTFTNPRSIKPGWELLLPADATNLPGTQPPGPDKVAVQQGDSLSRIAEDNLGDANQWPSLYEANRDVVGDDPDVIYPGQVLVLPGSGDVVDRDPGRAPGQPTLKPDDQGHRQDRADQPTAPGNEATADPSQEPAVPAAPPATPPTTPQERATEGPGSAGTTDKPGTADGADEQVDQQDESGITALQALLATAACLSVGALGLVAVNRRRQFRSRRPGRTIASTPAALAEVEQAVVEHGTEAQEDVEFLDRALRHVSACCRVAGTPLPHLGAAVLGGEDLTLLFTHPAAGQAPEGWTATDDAQAWVLPRWTFMEADLETQPAPYPALVSVGLDEGGRTWLLDLETLGVCGIGGAADQVADLARFMVAELAVNAWSEGSEVLLADQFGAETIGLNPTRLRQVDRGDALARAAVLAGEMGEAEQNLDADVLTRRRDGLLLDTTNPVVVVVPSRTRDEHADLAADVGQRERSRVVLVHAEEEAPAVDLVGDGMAFLPMWGVSVKAFTLPAAEAESMAALLDSTRNVEDQPVPASDSEDGPLGKYARVDGSLRVEYTKPRRSEGDDPSSLLPDADEVYVATAATTSEDMAAVAPSVPEETHTEIAALDPSLDQDLTDWFDESSPRPKVHLLGPVDVTAVNGGDRDSISNLGATIEFIVYLACQERGVTGERAAEACGWKTQKTVQNRATNARFLLGTRPDGSDWLPDASKSDSARRGDPTYELVKGTGGVLIDADLFVRLKFRAQKNGDNGCEDDLVAALALVVAEPFDNLRRGGYGWLFKGQRHDHIMVTAIQDAAHVLAIRAVADGRTDLVRVACDAARRANPHSDVAWLDLAAATEAEAGREAADEVVRDHIVDRLDEDLPARTAAVLDQRDQIRKLGSLWRTG